MKNRGNLNNQQFCTNCGLVIVSRQCPLCRFQTDNYVEMAMPEVKRPVVSRSGLMGVIGLTLLLIGFVFPNFVSANESSKPTKTSQENLVISTTTPLVDEPKEEKPTQTKENLEIVDTCVLYTVPGYERVEEDCIGAFYADGTLWIRDARMFDHHSQTHTLTDADKSAIQNALKAVQNALGPNFVQRFERVFSGEDFCWFDGNHEGNGLEILTDREFYDPSDCSVVFDTTSRRVNQEFASQNPGMYPIVEVTPIFLATGERLRWSSTRQLHLLIRTSWSFCEGSC